MNLTTVGRALLTGVAALSVGAACSQRPATPPISASPTPPPAPSGEDHLKLTLGTNDLPGCFTENAVFRVFVDSSLRDLRSHNELAFYWTLPAGAQPGAGPILLHMEGRTMAKELRPGDRIPKVEVSFPMDPAPLQLQVETSAFQRWSADGTACFGAVPSEPQTVPVPRQQARAMDRRFSSQSPTL